MAARSARSPSSRRRAGDGYDENGGGLAGFFAENRMVLGAVTAFAVAFSYVGANALWYQPHAHGGAFFQTRPPVAGGAAQTGQGEDVAEAETIIRLEPAPQDSANSLSGGETAGAVPGEARPTPPGDPVVEEVQRVLAGLNLYAGKVDGLTGPQTRTAIEAYRKMVGLDASGGIDEPLLQQLGMAPRAAVHPAPSPVRMAQGMDPIETSSAGPRGDATIMRIQAGLRAFGNDGIEIDGVVGSRTRAAIREFQALFGLPETGEPDAAVYAKMRDIGLTD